MVTSNGKKICPLLWISAILTLCMLLYFDFFETTGAALNVLVKDEAEDTNEVKNGTATGRKRLDSVFDTCELIEYPAWPKEIDGLLNPNYDPLAGCNRSWVPHTVLDDDGVVRMNPKYANTANESCFVRGLAPASDYSTNPGPWYGIEENVIIENDIIEVRCNTTADNDDKKAPHYGYLHYQIYRNNDTVDKASRILNAKGLADSYKPSIYVILLDSVASTQALRSLPKTLSYLESEFGAVRIRHLNKFGENSRPNGAALFLGKRIVPMSRQIYGMPPEAPNWDFDEICRSALDKTSFIVSDFEKLRGYVSLIAEDWAKGVYNWPNCIGFEKQPVTHYMRPYHHHLESTTGLDQIISTKTCHEHHVILNTYLEKFIAAYPDKPKFALTWASELGHNYADNVFYADKYFADFFKRNKEEFDKSFVFFMGDHGLRWGPVFSTEIGKVENNNPMLWLSVPRALRGQTALMSNLRKNAGELLTPFDIHATFVDLLKVLPTSNFTDYSTVPMQDGTQGNSIFRPLPKGPRNCKTLPIVPYNCLCHTPSTNITDKKILDSVGSVVAEAINLKLIDQNLSTVCHFVKEHSVLSVNQLKKEKDLYEVSVRMTPGDGEYMTMLQNVGTKAQPKFIRIVPEVQRTNAYGRSADCIEENDMRPYCYCRAFEEERLRATTTKT